MSHDPAAWSLGTAQDRGLRGIIRCIDALVIELRTAEAAERLCAALRAEGENASSDGVEVRVQLPASMRDFAQLLTLLEEALSDGAEDGGVVRIDGKRYLIEPRVPVDSA